MTKVRLNCLIDLLASEGYEIEYINNWTDAQVIYCFGKGLPQLTFQTACLSIALIESLLDQFQISRNLAEDFELDCACDW